MRRQWHAPPIQTCTVLDRNEQAKTCQNKTITTHLEPGENLTSVGITHNVETALPVGTYTYRLNYTDGEWCTMTVNVIKNGKVLNIAHLLRDYHLLNFKNVNYLAHYYCNIPCNCLFISML